MLWTFQKELVLEINTAFQAGFRAPLLQLHTGGGKTRIAAEIARRLFVQTPADRQAMLFLAHRRELIRQTYNTMCKFGLQKQIGVIAPDYPTAPWAKVILGSLPTVAARLHKLPWLNPCMVVFDEAHHIRAASWERVVSHFAHVPRLLLTATPARLDNKGIGKWADHLILGPTIPQLVEAGALCESRTFRVEGHIETRGMRVGKDGDYTPASLAKVDAGPVIADVVKSFERYIPHCRTLVFNLNIAASKGVVDRFRALGLRAEHVDGDTPHNLRDNIFERFGNGQTQILSNVMLATEGFDCPECDAVILARPTKSVPLYKQMVGRYMRRKADGRPGVCVDVTGVNCHYHGDPDEEIEWSLEDGVIQESVERAKSQGKTCPDCGFRFKTGQECPLCGGVIRTVQPREVDVELVESKKNGGKTTAGQRRRINQKVILSGGDEDVLRECAREMGSEVPDKLIFMWQRLWKDEWKKQAQRKERRKAQGELRYA